MWADDPFNSDRGKTFVMYGCAVVPNFKACCFCFSLRWSSLTIAIIYMMLSVPLTIIFGTPIVLHNVFGAEMETPTLFSYYLIVLSLVFQTLGGVLLIVAVVRKSPELMCPWIYVSFSQGAGLVILAAACTFLYIYQVSKGDIADDPEEPVTYTAYAAYGFVLYYCTSVVNSYKSSLHAERAARRNKRQAEMAPLTSIP